MTRNTTIANQRHITTRFCRPACNILWLAMLACAPLMGCQVVLELDTPVLDPCAVNECATCGDGVQNGLETAIDCGGPTCAACESGQACQRADDCQSGVCADRMCQPAGCGDAIVNSAEECDDGEETRTCDIDCTFAACGDGTTNASAQEECDDAGETGACDIDCTFATCGDGTTNASAQEECDDAGETSTCDGDCTLAVCGDGVTNSSAGEECDDGGLSTSCAQDCRVAYLASCAAILAAGLSSGDGVYTIDQDGPGPSAPLQVYCEMDFLGGGWLAVFNMMERPNVDAEAAGLFAALTVNGDMVAPVLPDSTSSAVFTENIALGDYDEVVYGWAPSATEDVQRWGTYTTTGGLTDECYVDGYCGNGVAVGTFDIQPAGTTRVMFTGNDPNYPHVGLGFSGQIITWGYDRNHSAYGGWANWNDANPCCNAGNTVEMTMPGWRYVIYIR